MKKKLSCLLTLISIQVIAFWSCSPNIINEIVTNVHLQPYTRVYVDSIERYVFENSIEAKDTNAYEHTTVAWAFTELTTLVNHNAAPSILAPFASSAYAFQYNDIYNRLQKIVSRTVFTMNDYNADFPALADISSICITDGNLPFNDISTRINSNDFPMPYNRNSYDYFVLKVAPTTAREVVLRIVYEFENNEKLHYTTNAVIIY